MPSSLSSMSSTHSTSEHHIHGRAASRLLNSVRRSITPSSKRHHRSQSHFNPHTQSMHIYPTPEESSSPVRAATFREPSYANARPSIEQIAMGLHISRTPHLLPSSPRSQHSYPQSHYSAPSSSPTLSPLRARPSIRKSKFGSPASSSGSDTLSPSAAALLSSPASASGSASASSSTVTSSSLYLITSTAASASAPMPRGAHGGSALSSLKLRMARLLPGEKKRSASLPTINGLVQQRETLGAEHLQRRPTTATTRKAVRFAQNDAQLKPRR